MLHNMCKVFLDGVDMRIISLKLKGYKRLVLRGITYFEYTPNQLMQLILGTNGSGKSSVLRELSPLPANHQDYFKDGFKEIVIEHRGKIFKLLSVFSPKTEHSFILDNNNLNQGGTLTVQRDLVKDYFNLDAELFSVLIDDVVFTNMPALKRRDWIIRLSGNDMSFALKTFQKIKGKLRDAQGVVKHLSKRLGDEVHNLPTQELIDEMRDTCDRLKRELNSLMQDKDPTVKNSKELESKIRAFATATETIARGMLKTSNNTNVYYPDMYSLECDIDKTRDDIASLNARLDAYHNEYSNYADIIKVMETVDNCGVDELQRKVDEVRYLMDNKLATLPESFIYLGSEKNYSDFTNALSQLVAILEEMPDKQYLRFTSESQRSNNERLTLLLSERQQLSGNLSELNHSRNHLKNSDLVQCPKCSLQFLAKVKGLDLETIENNIMLLDTAYNNKEKEIKEIQIFLDEFREYSAFLMRMKNLFGKYHNFSKEWENFKDLWKTNPTPVVALTTLSLWNKYADDAKAIFGYREYLKQQELSLSVLKSNSGQSSASIKNRISEIENHIVQTGHLLTESKQSLNVLNALKKYHSTLISEFSRLKEQTLLYRSSVDEYIKALYNDELDKEISERQSLLASTETLFIKASRAVSVIEDIKRNKEEVDLDLKALEIIVDELSPTEGLIAEQINAFMSSFVGAINRIIDKVWTYDLKVIPCSLADGDLDYQFPMSVNMHELPVPDVSKGSSSQVDIVNFAFKIVASLFLDMKDYPLYLDELAPSLDEQHRLNIIMFVKEFLELRNASQLFMISHYAAMHGAFSQTDICVMDSANVITLPEHFNKHVIIKRD